MNSPKTIRIRKGLNGFRYSACDNKGNFIGNFHKLSEISQYWKKEIQWKLVELVRELDKYPNCFDEKKNSPSRRPKQKDY